MNPTPLDYLRSFVESIPSLNAAFCRSLQGWGTETPPNTIIFAEVGEAIAANLPSIPGDELRKIFAAIEEGMNSQNADLKSAMATGLVEALVASVDRKPEIWEELEKLFGSCSIKHAVAWRIFVMRRKGERERGQV